jgi:hypothetical protein
LDKLNTTHHSLGRASIAKCNELEKKNPTQKLLYARHICNNQGSFYHMETIRNKREGMKKSK